MQQHSHNLEKELQQHASDNLNLKKELQQHASDNLETSNLVLLHKLLVSYLVVIVLMQEQNLEERNYNNTLKHWI